MIVVFNADDSRMASKTADGSIHLWDTQSGELVAKFDDTNKNNPGGAFSKDGRLLIVNGSDARVRLVRTDNGQDVIQFGHAESINQVALGPDNRRLVTWTTDGRTYLWNVDNGQRISAFGDGKLELRWSLLSPKGTHWLVATLDNRGAVLDAGTGARIVDLNEPKGKLTGYAFSADDRYLAVVSSDGMARVWDLQRGEVVQQFSHRRGVSKVAFSPNGRFLVTTAGRVVRTWHIETGSKITEIRGHWRSVTWAVFGPDENRIATFGEDGAAWLWNGKTGERLAPLVVEWKPGRKYDTRWLAEFSPSGSFVATAAPSENVLRLWQADDGTKVARFAGHTDTINDVAFNADESWVATAAADGFVGVWNAQTGHLLKSFRHPSSVESVELSSYGTKLIATLGTGDVHLWNYDDKRQVTIKSKKNQKIHAALGPLGKRLVTSSADGSVRLWSVETGAKQASIKIKSEGRSWLEPARPKFAADGSIVALFPTHGKPIIWKIPQSGQRLIDLARAMAPRRLTNTQRKTFHLDVE